MNKKSVYIQYITPQHLLTQFFGWLAQIRTPWLKNWMIKRFIRKYNVDMTTALIEDPIAYTNFNQFFTRQLKSHLRPIAMGAHTIASPVDGTISQIGQIHRNSLLQAKDFYYDLASLLGGDSTLTDTFHDGSFATLYLAPRDYHRIHMPLAGRLTHIRYIPGKLFSVNRITSECIPHLYSRNERLVTVFETEAGPMAVILVGAMIVGSIQTTWMDHPVQHKTATALPVPQDIHLEKGAELGCFKLGSTVILLFGKEKMTWSKDCSSQSALLMGQNLGKVEG